MPVKRTKNGVLVFDDFRENLIIDRYDPVFATMRGAKIEHLCSENSEDALTWNVFRSLRQVDPAYWFPRLFELAFRRELGVFPQVVRVNLWSTISPPPALRLFQKDEGDSEIDVLIETEYAVWFIEAKYKGDVSESTTNNPKRNQILRNIDVGSWYAGLRDFYFALLILNENYTRVGVSLIRKYAESKDEILSRLTHRPDKLSNLRGVDLLTWADLVAVLSDCSRLAAREEERHIAKRAREWLETKEMALTSTNIGTTVKNKVTNLIERRKSETIWSAGGVVTGATTGAIIGSVIGIAMGPLGAISGTVVGGVIVGLIGLLAGNRIGHARDDKRNNNTSSS